MCPNLDLINRACVIAQGRLVFAGMGFHIPMLNFSKLPR